MKSPILAVLALCAGGVVLAGCGGDDILPTCPAAAILSDTATVTGFRPGAPAELSGEAYTVTMTTLKTDCTFNKVEGRTDSSLEITLRATRAPSPDAASFAIPYYVAVTQGEKIVSKKIYTLQLSFAPGSAAASMVIAPENPVIDLETGHPPTDYQLLTGFQLTDAQRSYNSTRARYLP